MKVVFHASTGESIWGLVVMMIKIANIICVPSCVPDIGSGAGVNNASTVNRGTQVRGCFSLWHIRNVLEAQRDQP